MTEPMDPETTPTTTTGMPPRETATLPPPPVTAPPAPPMSPPQRRRGRPVLGGIAGFFFFLFVGLDLLLFGVIPLRSALLTILPIVGIPLGILWAFWAPLGGRKGRR